jgi:isocitrate dehydrogenase
VQQLVKENHLRWDSLGEFLALAVSLEMLAAKDGEPRAKLLGRALDRATGSLLENGKSPSRKVGENDNRGSHYWLARYWARELADQDEDAELAGAFGALAERLERDEEAIVAELDDVQGDGVDLGGYYHVDRGTATRVMRPSETFNAAIDAL